MSNELVPIAETSPLTLFTRATDVAGVCGEIVKRTARQIQGRKFVQVEGWQSIAAAYGCIASSTHVEKVEGGMRAIGELRRASDGVLLGTAEGFVGEDEPTWYGGELRGKTLPKRAEYAIRAMAQTRAISRVCRSAFAFVVVLIDNKLSTTPAEEMDPDWTENVDKNAAPQVSPKSQVESTGATHSPSADAAPKTRTDTLQELCKKASVNYIDLLSKAEVKHADEMSNADYMSAVNMLERKIAKAHATSQG